MIVKVDGVVVYRNTQVGVQGPPGAPGAQGADGAPGPAGADGSNVVWRGAWDALGAYSELDGVQHAGSAWVAAEGVLVGDEPGVDASWGLWVSKGDPGPQGEQGAQGEKGDPGSPGEQGPKGDPGEPGPAGTDGQDGADGREVELQKAATHIQWRLAGDSWQNLIALSELEGPQGEQGPPGEKGDTGEPGPKGDKGDAGDAGVGVPAGGAAGQVLKKSSGADYATAWEDESSGGGSTVAINAQTGTSYTLVLADAGKLITLSNGSAIALTVPTNASVAFPVGTVIALAQLGAGLVTVEGDTGVTINGTTPGDDDLAGQWATASLTKLATDTWLLSGGVA